ncbi:tetratricopeptide repeat protein [Acinetobacter sp. NIPH 1852]|uniref:YbgF trimerization domain-containing protein n=1 Tax=Acinetobacter sp. NIPH 1852 TaxID=2923428 RepID=UPI001B619824|nr:YbgF trimerization domain-containing protein [Acinetobacter sp. NIPH 1852]MBP7879936.1 tetratricopeptide repeat protein [Acinetobacter sp.]MCH7307323.1 tetratricopeptide repeat protein [Acinetobacter sp. NIPH 1852]
MLKKHSVLFVALLSSAHLYANVPIESRALSQQSANTGNTANVGSNLNWDLIQKNQRLEEEVRKLRGQLEEHDNAIEQLKKELTNRYTDLDQRLELLSQKIDPPEEHADEPIDASQPVSNTVTASTPVEAQPQPSAAAANINANNQLELEKAAYTVALDAYKQGGAKQAIQPMQNFIKNHPNGIYIGNAYFWLAEFYLAITPANYTAAKQNYNTVVNNYPNSARASRALYQLYSIANEVDKNTAQANQYKTKLLAQYPQSEEAKFIQKK